ncbi:glycoside-pentoside-hexuronide (GPH):cation symporter [Kluyvera cryocrescens]|uniref:Glycoside-pentoside-hexuronide (GPH):cation symporter n=2 Tax=Kluyvera cryocrescens TaxID=580 RepID=A0AAW9C4C8_KLUCR|nr:glycoside-pentoside-hexuronide (GPH):cation symporter [Kluyvera cryocrescens]MCX2868560.1 glycoside-pentoside-hexuronide (GPH):cation symporter [Kluyvera cryocrescens]MDW3776015.1 glycoside-pentoside-hexuronide (GPH):cation symporter [Kluyvera cryocrescens]MEB6634386.1 glycoside-pentoside-hexuronide (GPH):cation symporter [Kluyvera cryocrescens]MEB7557249.1 glycoside-pentoside-hexuronide (GPH):cation symporter [Kluyvera cryocrescens]MEB7714323.1 glycoside-pentoside-hexuronide (GPH):cation s
MSALTGKISNKEKFGFGLGDAASHIVFDSSVAILAYFYTNIYGLPPAVMGTLFLVVRVLDAITDPIMGAIADQTKSRWGRFRPWLLIICVPFAVSCVLVYSTPNFEQTGKIVYAVVAYIFMTLMYTAINIPYCSLGAAITADPKENLSLQSWRFAVAPIGGAMGTALILPLADLIAPGDRATGMQWAMGIFGAIGCIMFLICFMTTRERITPVKEENLNILRDVRILMKNDQWRVLSIYNLAMLCGVVVRGSLLVYFVQYILHQGSSIISLFMLATTVAAVVGSLMAKQVGSWMCKIRASVWVNILSALFGLAFLILPSDYWIPAFIVHIILNILQGINAPLQWSMITDANNYGEWKTQRRITGMNVAANIFIIKLGVAIGGALTGWGLAFYGYQAGVEQQSAEAIRGVLILFTVLPAIFYLITAISIRYYRLTEDRMNAIVSDLSEGKFQQQMS